MNYIVEYNVLGCITYAGDLQEGEEDSLKESGTPYLKTETLADVTKQCVIKGKVVAKEDMNTKHTIKNGVVVFSEIPKGTFVIVGDVMDELKSKGIEIEFDEVGKYLVEFTHSPCHLACEVEVEIE